MKSNVIRRININLTVETDIDLKELKIRYKEAYGKTTEADIIRDAIQIYETIMYSLSKEKAFLDKRHKERLYVTNENYHADLMWFIEKAIRGQAQKYNLTEEEYVEIDDDDDLPF